MDTTTAIIIAVASILASFGLLGLAAAWWGVDSRPTIGDSHVR